MRTPVVVGLVVLAGVVAVVSPAAPFLARYGTLPRKADGPVNLVLAGVDVEYNETAPVWPYPAQPESYRGGRTRSCWRRRGRTDG